MKQHDYDKILYRLMSILTRLSDGKILGKEELAKEFNVSSKTIQRDFNEQLMQGHHLSNYKVDVLEKDKYGRELCIVHDGDKSYNENIIADCYAVVYQGGKYIKDDTFKRKLLQAQKEAKSNNRGLWNGSTKKIMEGME